LAVAVAARSVRKARLASVSAGSACFFVEPAIVRPQRRPSTTIDVGSGR